MNTPNAAKVLNSCIQSNGWTQQELAAKTGIARSTISFHLIGERAIRDEHLAVYLGVLSSKERPTLLTAWLRDVMPADIIDEILDRDRLKSVVKSSAGRENSSIGFGTSLSRENSDPVSRPEASFGALRRSENRKNCRVPMR